MQLMSFTGLDINCEVLFSAVLIDLVCVCPALGIHRKSPLSVLFVVVVCLLFQSWISQSQCILKESICSSLLYVPDLSFSLMSV